MKYAPRQTERAQKLQKKDRYKKEDGTAMSMEEIEAVKAAKYEAAGGKVGTARGFSKRAQGQGWR